MTYGDEPGLSVCLTRTSWKLVSLGTGGRLFIKALRVPNTD